MINLFFYSPVQPIPVESIDFTNVGPNKAQYIFDHDYDGRQLNSQRANCKNKIFFFQINEKNKSDNLCPDHQVAMVGLTNRTGAYCVEESKGKNMLSKPGKGRG